MFDIQRPQAVAVYSRNLARINPNSAVLGRARVSGLGLITLFSDSEAKAAYAAYVRPFEDHGSFCHKLPSGDTINVFWGK